ncbi:hypothetical protein MASR2M17_14490 [Aminivibrio sp.]
MEARKILECSLARLAAERALPEDIDEMSAAVKILEDEGQGTQSEKVIEADLDFHYALASASANHSSQPSAAVDFHLQKGRSTTIGFLWEEKLLKGIEKFWRKYGRKAPMVRLCRWNSM